MNTVNRILLHIIRKPYSSIMIVLLFVVLCMGTLLCLSVGRGAEVGINELLHTMAASYKIAVDKTQTDPGLFETVIFEDGSSMTQYLGGLVDDDLVEKLLSSAEYQSYNLTKLSNLVVRGISLCPGSYTVEAEAGDAFAKSVIIRTYIIGVLKSMYQDYFTSGAVKLVEGRHVESDDIGKVVISKDLAERNQFTIGDIFTIEANELVESAGLPHSFVDKTIGEPMPVEIVGIFEIFDGYNPPEHYAEAFRLENFIFADMQTLNTIYSEYKKFTTMEYDDITFFVDDPAKLDGAVERLSDLDVEWQYYAITKGDSKYEASAKPLHMIRTVLTFLTGFLLLGCTAVLFLTLKFQQESRKREAGVLLSIGISHSSLVAQYLLEALILLILAFSLTVWLAPPIAQRFGDRALSASVSMTSSGTQRVNYDYLKAEFVVDAAASPPETLIVHIGVELFGLVGLAAAVVAMLSTLLSILPVVKMKPIDILTIPR